MSEIIGYITELVPHVTNLTASRAPEAERLIARHAGDLAAFDAKIESRLAAAVEALPTAVAQERAAPEAELAKQHEDRLDHRGQS
ncbi:hypothetical protein [Segnochrobactrum spirostomi]|uniref:Uncharacterized protein n=1 Tax=Segnochrobactrum spirostomi TaxID=2608987 RepID=A0A6A7XZ11_9HYPH|nr:hypothetical protein [Segnochrobactrum spirostomi]MQT11151.1 hypothetical protein [Segnochrobactrum spirostomi]